MYDLSPISFRLSILLAIHPNLHLSASSFEKYSQCYQQPIFVYFGLFGRHPLRCVGEMRLQPTTSQWSLKNGTQIKSILPKSRSQDRQVILDFQIIAQLYFEAIFNPIQCSFGVCKYKLYGLLPFRFSIQQRSVTILFESLVFIKWDASWWGVAIKNTSFKSYYFHVIMNCEWWLFCFCRSSDVCESEEDSLESSSDDEGLLPTAAHQDSLKEGWVTSHFFFFCIPIRVLCRAGSTPPHSRTKPAW